jgi:RNA-directed DNA polymerase
LNKTYKPSPYRVKQIYVPKTRDIYIAPFYPDRIIHHAVVKVLGPIWEKLFIYDSYACIKGKGQHRGSRRTMEFVRRNHYCLKCDISKFYPSMWHDVLFRIVQRKIKCRDTLQLLKEITYSIPGGRNVPIGNYTSQWFGNVYLTDLDYRVKHYYRIRDYVRYCDDFILFSDDKRRLREIAKDLEQWLMTDLGLKMSKCELFPVTSGVDFLGYRHFPDYILLRKSTAMRIKRRLKLLPGLLNAGRLTLDQVRSSVASSMGWMKWANTHNMSIRTQIAELEGFINERAAAQAV